MDGQVNEAKPDNKAKTPAKIRRRATGTKAPRIAMDSPDRFINRELSWLSFNTRVLEEAYNKKHPLLERLRFLSISAGNLDEFYMVRVAGLKGQVAAGISATSDDGLTPERQLDAMNAEAGKLLTRQQACFNQLCEELRDEGIALVRPSELTAREKGWLEQFFLSDVFPVLTPLAIDPAHPFPFIPNFGFSLILLLQRKEGAEKLSALIPIPHQVDRFIRLPGNDIRFFPMEDLILMSYPISSRILKFYRAPISA